MQQENPGKNNAGFASIHVSFSRYFILNRIGPCFSCEKTFLNITHDRKGISKFPHMVLQSFMVTIRICLFHFEKILITESGARRSLKWANFRHAF